MSESAAPAPAAGSRSTGALVVVPAGSVAWAVDAAQVVEIIDEGELAGAAPIDVPAALGLARGGAVAPRRVLALRTEKGYVWVRAEGAVTIRQLGPSDLMPLPAEVRRGRVGAALAGVVFDADSTPLLVVHPSGLAAAATRRSEEKP